MGSRLYIIIGLTVFIFLIIHIQNFTEGFEQSHLENYYSNKNPDYTIPNIHFAKGTTSPAGTSAPFSTTSPTGTSAPFSTISPEGATRPIRRAYPYLG